MIKKGLAIIGGSLLFSIGINGFLVPYHLLDGGMIGLALIMHYFFEVQTGLAMIFLSIPLFIYAWFKQRTYFYNSLHGLFVSSLLLDLLAPLRHVILIPLPLSSITGGLFIGLGIGLMLRFETSTGGTDLLAQMISTVVKLNVGLIIFILDGIVVLMGYKTLGLSSFLYSCVVIAVVGVTTSMMVKKT